MQSEALTIVEANSEGPLLPVQLVAGDLEGRAVWLHDLVRLGGRPRLRSQVGVVLAHGGVFDSAAIEGSPLIVNPLVVGGRQPIDLGYLESLRDFCAEI